MTDETRIFLVRHGQTEWNLQDRLQGHEDSPLIATGKAQAQRARESLAGKFRFIRYSDSVAVAPD